MSMTLKTYLTNPENTKYYWNRKWIWWSVESNLMFTYFSHAAIQWMISPTSFLKQFKKKLVGLTREHEALFNFVENNKQICTEKEKQKVSPTFHHYLCIFAYPGRRCLKTWTCLLEMLFPPALDNRCLTGWVNRQRCKRGWMRTTLTSTWRVIRRDSSGKTHWKTATRCWRTLYWVRFCWNSAVPLIQSGFFFFFEVKRYSRITVWLAQGHLICSKSWTSELLFAENGL